MRLSGLIFLLFPTLLLAFVDVQLPNKDFAYYGAEFYAQMRAGRRMDKLFIHRILNGTHSAQSRSYDTIGGSCARNCYRHEALDYSESRKVIFGHLDVEKDGRGTYVRDVYCGKKFHFRSVEDVRDMHSEVNIEHTWPQSKFTGRFDKRMQKSDMHHLYPADSDANNRRANHDFGEISDAADELNVTKCDESRLAHVKGEIVFMPPSNHLGNVARSMFYFSVRYDLPIDANDEAILRQWNKMDPVDADEMRRNDLIAGYQKVRNPFVDYPELVQLVSDF
jgi:deoxyribonuclease I